MSENPGEAGGVRLNKALADAGLCSRRKADELIFAGRVTVNGMAADSPGLRVGASDLVEVDGRPVRLRAQGAAVGKAGEAHWTPCWLMLHKPVGVVSTASDPEGRRTVLDFVPPAGLFFGRIDPAYGRRRAGPPPQPSALASAAPL